MNQFTFRPMPLPTRMAIVATALVVAFSSTAIAQSSREAPLPERGIRRTIPLQRTILQAFAAGTRDSSGSPGAKYWQQWVNYTIHASLDPKTAIVTGHEIAVLHNHSPDPISSITLRLDQNLFSDNVPRTRPVSEITGGMTITKLVVNGEPLDLKSDVGQPVPYGNWRFPPLKKLLKQTSASIQIPSAPGTPNRVRVIGNDTLIAPGKILPNDSCAVEIEWSFRVPLVEPYVRGDRMGRWADSLFQLGQWYPRIAVYDDMRPGEFIGPQKGWDAEEYLGTSEFYNNFGHFDVTLDVPAGWLVGATGVLQNPADVLTPVARERLSHVLESDSTRTIVGPTERATATVMPAGGNGRLQWHFVADTAGDFAWATSNQYVWVATRATIPGHGPIPVHIFYLPGHARQYQQVDTISRHALQFYSRLWMPYAFPQLTVVDGPENGMEYPMFVMSGRGAVDHEIGHQWWPMMVGVNETWYPFMDEGFNQYMNVLSAADAQHTAPNLNGMGQSYGGTSGNEQEAPIMWNANFDGPMYFFTAYSKPPQMLSSLGGVVGDSAVQRAMREYAVAWRFKHPSPWDFMFFMNRALHRDLGWFWYYWLFTTESVDGSIDTVVTTGHRTIVTVKQSGEMPSPVVLKVQFAAKGTKIKPMSHSVMTDSVTAIVTYPVDVWFRGSRTFKATLDFGGRAIEHITLDPDGRFPDRNAGDNVWPRQAPPKREPAARR